MHAETDIARKDIALNLADLRGRLTHRLALFTLVFSQLLPLFLESPIAIVTWLVLTAVSAVTVYVSSSHPLLARHLLVWGMLASLLVAMWFFPQIWLPFLAVILVFCSAFLLGGSEFVIAAVVIAATWLLVNNGSREYPLVGLVFNISLAVVAAGLTTRALYLALSWLWRMNQQTEQLLTTTREQQGRLRSVIKSLETTTELRLRAEHELLLANQEANRARQLKEQFAANISHELRTPLSIILGFSEVMYLSPEVYGDFDWPQQLYRDVSQIYRNSRHLLGMIDDILDLSRFEMIGFTLNRQRQSLAPLLEESAAIVVDLFQEGLHLEVDIAPDLPAVDVDETRLRQVLLNLLNNARRFTEAGTVRLVARREGDEILVFVADTGPGIAPDKLHDIFNEFYQVDFSLSRRHGGAGLGLAICKRFVEAHEGRIWAESQPGEGATFFFTLPIPGVHLGRPVLQRLRPQEPVLPERRPRLVVVGPGAGATSVVRRHLEAFDVVHVEDEVDLGAALEMHHPLAVVRNLPPRAPRARLMALRIPVIECSLPNQAWLMEELGASACLTKPLQFGELAAALAALDPVTDIIVVDDNPGICQLVERGLAAMNRPVQLRVAYDGVACLEMLRQRRPDVLILDLVMPEMDGFGVIAAMRADPALADTPIVLLTATSYSEDSVNQSGDSVKIYRDAPFSPGELMDLLAALTGTLRA